MKARLRTISLLSSSLMIAVAGAFLASNSSEAAPLSTEQKRELASIRRTASKASSEIRRKNFDEAETLLDEAEATLKKVQEAAGLKDDDRIIAGYKRTIDIQRKVLAKVQGAGKPQDDAGVSFAKDVAPILEKNCTRCHGGDRSNGNLRVDTFAGMKKGGASGPLLVRGNATGSLIMARLAGLGGKPGMPRGGKPLDKKEIFTIGAWIQQGAKFDGKDEDADIASLGKEKKDVAKIEIPKPTGDETVSFTKDIAPWMANLCLNCHNDRRKSSGFSVANFQSIMEGGDTGRVLLPGNLDGSRLWDLVGKQDPIKMPQGQALITKTNHANLKTWIMEGAKFDGKDPKTPLRELVPTEAEKMAGELAKLSPEEFQKMRLDKAQETWKRVLPKVTPRWVESDEFYIFGDVPQTRLQEIDGWAEAHGDELRKMFNIKSDEPLWKGRLTVFVFQDRFGYDEFNQVVERRDAAREMTAHSNVSPSYSEAYIAMLDIGDEVSADSPGLKLNVVDHVTGAFLKRGGGNLPAWVTRGTGLAIAARTEKDNAYIQSLSVLVPKLVADIRSPEDVLADGTFSPTSVGPVGYALVSFLMKNGSPAKFGQFINQLKSGSTVDAALRTAYKADRKAVGAAFLTAVGSK